VQGGCQRQHMQTPHSFGVAALQQRARQQQGLRSPGRQRRAARKATLAALAWPKRLQCMPVCMPTNLKRHHMFVRHYLRHTASRLHSRAAARQHGDTTGLCHVQHLAPAERSEWVTRVPTGLACVASSQRPGRLKQLFVCAACCLCRSCSSSRLPRRFRGLCAVPSWTAPVPVLQSDAQPGAVGLRRPGKSDPGSCHAAMERRADICTTAYSMLRSSSPQLRPQGPRLPESSWPRQRRGSC
jgi:hypothetical protein